MMFGGRSRLGKTSSHTAAIEASSCIISEETDQGVQAVKKFKAEVEEDQTASLANQQPGGTKHKKLGQLLEPKFLVETIVKAVASNLNMGKINNAESSPSGFVSKPYLGRPHPSQLAPGVDGSLHPSLTCQNCKDTSHLKDNCVKLT